MPFYFNIYLIKSTITFELLLILLRIINIIDCASKPLNNFKLI